jgi:predicted N-formylglutamate amidohydrolase
MAVVLSCEHGGNHVPKEYEHLFKEASSALDSHRGWDAGALALFKAMKGAGVHYGQFDETTRLLIDLNRSLNRRTLFSEFSGVLSAREKKEVIDRFYKPFRKVFKESIDDLLVQSGFIFHVSVHSFTPVFKGETRNADVGLLYNPSFGREKALAHEWRVIINRQMPGFKVRMNYPYLGKTDGHVAALRKSLGTEAYAGIELEMSQKYAGNRDIIARLARTFHELILPK